MAYPVLTQMLHGNDRGSICYVVLLVELASERPRLNAIGGIANVPEPTYSEVGREQGRKRLLSTSLTASFPPLRAGVQAYFLHRDEVSLKVVIPLFVAAHHHPQVGRAGLQYPYQLFGVHGRVSPVAPGLPIVPRAASRSLCPSACAGRALAMGMVMSSWRESTAATLAGLPM